MSSIVRIGESTKTYSEVITALLHVCIAISLLVVGLLCNYEHRRNTPELVIVVRSLKLHQFETKRSHYPSLPVGHARGVWGTATHGFFESIIRECSWIRLNWRLARRDWKELYKTMLVQEYLAILSPIVIACLLIPAYITAIVGRPEDIVLSSMIPTSLSRIALLVILSKVSDISTATFLALSAQTTFYMGCALHAALIHKVKFLLKSAR